MDEPISKLKRKRNYRALHELDQYAYRTLNDRVIETVIVVQALNAVGDEMDAGKLFIEAVALIPVPTVNEKTTRVKRERAAVRELVRVCAESREYAKALVQCVAEAEDHLASLLRLILKAYPDRLKISVKGNDGKIQVDLDQILAASTIDDIIEEKIALRVQQALYASPSTYLKYINTILHREMPEVWIKKFSEVKATRDIFVHAQGVINEVYLEKAGELSRGQRGERLVINREYFEAAVRTIKHLYISTYKALMRGYGDDEKLAAVLMLQPRLPESRVDAAAALSRST